ncbi:MAG: peptidoglycan DD-metalloendopeptidase family protein [Bacilli bacterium]|nr:peptidoglycan DD-metalloendopeptidase family protein [Bacilli bacterium]
MRNKVVTILVILVVILVPLNIKADSKAKNIKELNAELEELKRQKNINVQNKNATRSSINQKKQAIYNAYNEKQQAENDINAATNKIAECEASIEKTKGETAEILKFNELTSNENIYLEYLMAAESIADMSMRSKAISLITSYNQDQLQTLNDLIIENQRLKEELREKQNQLDVAINNYSNAIVALDNYMDELEDVGDDINEQIKNQEALIKYYKSICTSDTQLLSDCVKVLASSTLIRPLEKGVVTSPFGMRVNPLTGKTSSFHYGIDLSTTSMGVKVYSAANGMVAAVTLKSSCGGNIVYIHHNVNGVAYTTQYAHLLSVNVKVGDTVTNQSVIGYVGGAGSTLKKNGGWDTCSTGVHLHYSISKGYYLGGGANGYSSFSKFKANMIDPGKYFPARGTWFYRRY